MDDLGSHLKGYTQVTEFEPDVDEEFEEEEVSSSREVAPVLNCVRFSMLRWTLGRWIPNSYPV